MAHMQGQRTYGRLFSSSTKWVLEMKLRSLALGTGTFYPLNHLSSPFALALKINAQILNRAINVSLPLTKFFHGLDVKCHHSLGSLSP